MNARTLLIASVLAVSGAVTGCNCGPTPTGTKLVFTAQPQGGQAGSPFTPAVQVSITDDQGNVVTTASGQVALTLEANPGGDTLGGTLTQTAVEGVATFSDLRLTRAAAGYKLKATSSGLTDAVSDPFSIDPGPPAALSFTQAPSDAAAGAAIAPPVTVALLDAFGNQTAAAAAVTISISTGPAGAALGGTATVTSAAGVATFPDLTLDLEGAYTLSASSGSLPVLVSPSFNVRAGAPASLAFTVQPSSATAGTPIAPAVQVTLLDARGNVSRSATDAVTISIGTNAGGGTLSGTLTKNAVNGVATFTDLSVDKAGAGYTLHANSGALPQATSSAFDITAGAASTLAFTVQPSSTSAGTAISPAVQVSILDAFGNRTSSTAPVTVAVGNNPGGATLSGTPTRSAVAGVATFNDLSLDKVGTGYTLTAASAGLAGTTSTAFDVISSATPTQLAFRTQPSSAAAGAPISPAVEVLLLDAFGNRTNSTAAVTVSIGTNPAGGTLSGTRTVNAVAGLATFSDLSIDRAGAGYTLVAASAGVTSVTSNGFDIAAGLAAALVFVQQPTSAAAGAILSPPVQVAIVDTFGNQTGSTAVVSLSIATGPGSATLGGTTAQAAVGGLATFADLSLTTAGTYSLAASASGLASTTSNTFTISAGAASKLVFTVEPSSATAGTAIAPAVQVSIQDAFGNPTNSTANVTVSIGNNPSSGTLSGTLTRAASGGVASFANLSIDKAGAGYTLTASSAGLTGATSAAFDITAGPAAKLAFTVQPSNAAAGAAITPAVVVTVQDAQGNTVTTSSATVSVALGNNPGGGTLSGSTLIAANNGVATFSGLSVDKVGTGYTLVASSSGLTGATSAAFNITGSAADHLVFTTQPSNATAGAGIAPAVRVAVVDAFGNTVVSSTASVTVAIGNNPGGGTLSGTATVAAVNGIATFSTLSIDKAGTGYTLTAASAGLTGATSVAFNVTAGTASQLAFVQQPTTTGAGLAITPAVTVAILDAFGNQTASTATVTVAIGTNPGGGTLSGTTSVAAVAGVATFSNLSINKAGTGYTLNATSAGLGSATSSAFDIVPASGLHLVFITPARTFTAGLCPGVAGVITVQLQDVFGNPVTAPAGGVSFTASSDSSGTVTWYTDSACASVSAGGGFTIAAGTSAVNLFYKDTKAGTPFVSVSSGGALFDPTPQQHTVVPAAASRLAFTGQPSNAVAGAGIGAVQVSVQDAFGNVVTSSSAMVNMAIGTNPGGGTLSGATTVAAVSGVATFSTLSINKAGIGYTLVASSAGLTSATSNAFNITAAAAAQLAFVQQPTNAAAGAAISPAVTVAIQDAFGNQTASTATVTLVIGTNPGGGTLSGATSVAAVAGVATFSNLSINRAGTGYTLTAASAGLTGATSSGFNITSGAAAAVVFQQQPSNTAAGASISPAVTAAIVDAGGNVVITSTANVTVAIGNNPGGGTLSGATTAAAVNGVATFSNLSIDKVGAGYTLVASSAGLTSATSNAFNVTSAGADHLVFVTQPRDAPAGGGFAAPSLRVAVVDAFGNTVTSSSASVTLAIGNNPGGGTLSGTKTVAAVAGIATFSTLSIDKAGNGYTLVASSPGLISATSVPFNITAGPAAQLAFVQQPSNAAAGAAITPAVTVAILDAFGNQTASTATVALAIGTNPGGGTLSGTTSAAAVAGVATFSNLSINKAGTGYTLNATSAGLGSAASSAFNITAGPAAAVVFQQQPTNTQAGASITPAVTAAIVDAGGNVVTTSTATVTMAIGTNPGGGTLSGTTSVAAVAGVATFSNLSINAAGTGYTLVASSAGLTSATSSPFNIGSTLATKLGFITQLTNAVAGAAFTVRVAIQDPLGNTVTTSTATVTIAIGNNPGGGTLGGTLSVAAVAGVATFSNLTINKAGTGYTLVASSPGLTSATSAAFNISSAAADHLSFAAQPPNGTAGAGLSPAVQVAVLDAFGNVVTASTASVTLAIGTNPSGGTLSGTLTVAATAGVATFSNLSIDRAGNGYTLVASSGGLISATSAPFNITASPASRLAFGQQPSNAAAGAAISPAVTVLVQDALGNTVTTSTATVTMAIGTNPGGGTLGGTTSVAAVAGVATFSTLTISAAGTGYTLVAASVGLTSATSSAFDITTVAAGGLSYTDPPAGGKIRLVRNAASTSTTVVLDLVAAVPLTGFQVGFNLPLDTTRVQANATLQTPGTALPAGSAPIAAKAVIPAAGPLANVMVSGQSQKAAGAGAVPANSSVPAGAVFYQLRLDLKAGATAGTVFDGAALGAQFAGNMRDRAGTDVAVSTDFVIGKLVVN